MQQLKQTLIEKKFENQYGSLIDMLTLNPRTLSEGHVFYTTTNDKLYTIIPASMINRSQSIKDVRSGNFVWQEITVEESKEGVKYNRGEEILHHSKLVKYPDDKILDDVDCVFELTNDLRVGNDELRNKWKSALTFKEGEKLYQKLEEVMGKKIDEEWIKKKEGQEGWPQNIFIQLYEHLFLEWASN